MRKVDQASDFEGQTLQKGDFVTVLHDNVSAKVCDLAVDSGTAFVRLRPSHQPFGRGVWHAAEHVLRTKSAKR